MIPCYGYRRVRGLLRCGRETRSQLPINVKRVYRVMGDHQLLLERRIKQPGVAHRHEDPIAVATSETRWCSDGFEFLCEEGAKLSMSSPWTAAPEKPSAWWPARQFTAVTISAN